MSGFKLLAIIPLKDCSIRFRKNIEIGEVYQFYKGHTITMNEDLSEIKSIDRNDNLIIENLYELENEVKLSISAIVGKNGSGKSSLLELLFYFIYKIAIDKELIFKNSTKIMLENESSRKKLIDFSSYLNLVTEIEKIGFLKREGYQNESLYFLALSRHFNFNDIELKFTDSSDIKNRMIDVMNKHLLEQKNRIAKEIIFDKIIDSNLNVDIVFESNGKLYDLSIQNNSYKFKNWDSNVIVNDIKKIQLNSLFYTISINYSHHSLNSSLLGGWLDGLFHKNDGYKTPLVINPMRNNGNVDINREENFAKSRLLANIIDAHIKGQESRKVLLNERQKVIGFEFKINEKKNNLIKYSWKSISEGDHLEVHIIKQFLLNELNIEINQLKLLPFSDDIVRYIISKFHKIVETYDGYSDISRTKKSDYDYVKEVHVLYKKDNSHVVFKMKQAINFIERNLNTENLEVWEKEKEVYIFSFDELIQWGNIKKVDSYKTLIEKLPPSIFDLDFILTDSDDDSDQLLLKIKVDNEISILTSRFGMLSSGEKQLIHSVQTVVYHLNNIDSISPELKETGRISYSNVNVIFDEIELYFHPDLQRKFIDYLIKSFNRLNVNIISEINVVFATHSPFILSDIPSQNVLKLEDGKPSFNLHKESFAANIHDLLEDSFFLDSIIGKFAHKKVDELFRILQDKDDVIIKQDELKKLIDIISEPLVREPLIVLYDQKFKTRTISDFYREQLKNYQFLIDNDQNTSQES
jgi:AAA15 family ATPase/GTPase